MEFPTQILALLNTGSPNTGGGFLDALKGPLLILVVALGLALVIAIVILVTHRDGGTKQSRQGHSARLTTAKPRAPGEEGEPRKKRRRHKRRRRDHRKRNPTLSETGGLPSKKDDTPGEPKVEEEQ
ncbi:MAG: hypothetical protein HOF22_04670 [Verrucomicrobia bacterium]|nr:hypothetical protein [Verrucomicrobiota bacterium]